MHTVIAVYTLKNVIGVQRATVNVDQLDVSHIKKRLQQCITQTTKPGDAVHTVASVTSFICIKDEKTTGAKRLHLR